MPEPLDSELTRHLAPVAAPDELWDRVCEKRGPRRREFYVPLWAAAAVLLSLGGGSLAAWREVSAESRQVKPAAMYTSRTVMKAEDCRLCHTI